MPRISKVVMVLDAILQLATSQPSVFRLPETFPEANTKTFGDELGDRATDFLDTISCQAPDQGGSPLRRSTMTQASTPGVCLMRLALTEIPM
jgi:hypothetical protein